MKHNNYQKKYWSKNTVINNYIEDNNKFDKKLSLA